VLPRPLAGLRGPTSKEKEGQKRGRGGEARESEKKGQGWRWKGT